MINNIWLYKVKEKVDGSTDRLKAILVDNGVRQVEGCDYHETFASVVKPVIIILVLISGSVRKVEIMAD